MFNFVRNHPRITMTALGALLFPSFVLFGVSNNFFDSNPGAAKVARVKGQHDITQADWDRANERARNDALSQYPNLDSKVFDSPVFKYQTLEKLLSERVLTAAAADERLTVSNAQLARALQPLVDMLRTPDGKLDMERYKQFTAQQGTTPEGFEASFRAQLALQQVMAGVNDVSLSSPALADVAARAQQERRMVRIALFKPSDYSAKLTPSDADLQAFYKAHLAQYQAPESAKIEYVVLDMASVKANITVSDADLQTYYQQNMATLAEPEQRRASHILIAADKNAPAADRAKAKARAEALLAQLRQNPADFAELAKKDSQDPTTAMQGGDLGWFQKADKGMAPVISQAAFALASTGNLSGVVESDLGYHIVQLTGIKPAHTPSFEQVRAQLEDQYRTQKASDKFSDLADTFTNTVYEQSDSLKPAADPLKLSIQTAEVTRTPAPGAQGVLANPKFLAAIFSPDARDKKNNTQAIQIGPSQLAAGRVVSYSPAHAQPYAQVKDAVRAAYLAERGAQLARQAGEQQFKAWRTNPASANSSLGAPVALSRQDAGQQPAALLEAVLRTAPSKLPTWVGVNLGASGYAVAQVEKVLPPATLTADQSAQNLDHYNQQWAAVETAAYYGYLKDLYKARILVPQPIFIPPVAGTAAAE